jgi:hypothetical protein
MSEKNSRHAASLYRETFIHIQVAEELHAERTPERLID